MSKASDEERESRWRPRRKNTKINCGGHQGREHQLVFRIDPRKIFTWRRVQSPVCYEAEKWIWKHGEHVGAKTYWECYHIVICTRCSKIIDHYPQCPYKPAHLEPAFSWGYKTWDLEEG